MEGNLRSIGGFSETCRTRRLAGASRWLAGASCGLTGASGRLTQASERLSGKGLQAAGCPSGRGMEEDMVEWNIYLYLKE